MGQAIEGPKRIEMSPNPYSSPLASRPDPPVEHEIWTTVKLWTGLYLCFLALYGLFSLARDCGLVEIVNGFPWFTFTKD